jgi:hypothetical protein
MHMQWNAQYLDGDAASPAVDRPDASSDSWLRSALTDLDLNGFDGQKDWEAIGAMALAFARRDGRHWRNHADEYVGAYVAAVISLFRERAASVIQARSPWGLAVAKGRFAGQTAVGAEATCGLTDRDPVSHRVRFADVPRIVSFDGWAEGPAETLAS